MNRLNLDFSLSSDEARAEYVQTYIQNFDVEKPLTNSELEKLLTISYGAKIPKVFPQIKAQISN